MQDPTIQARFSAAAATYDSHSEIQSCVIDSVVDLLRDIPTPERLIEVGCGTGRLTQRVGERFPNASITALDLSGAMIDRAKRNLSGAAKNHGSTVEFVTSDICEYRPDGVFPLLLSSSSLHWIVPFERAIDTVDRLVMPGGHMVIAIMLRDTLSELYESRMRIAKQKPPEHRLPELAEFVELANRQGWVIQNSFDRHYVSRYGSVEELLASLRQQGLTGGSVSRSHTPLTRGELQRLRADYTAHYQDDRGLIPATYYVGFLHAIKPEC
jgi:malonyl-CoA O-methyltransferase